MHTQHTQQNEQQSLCSISRGCFLVRHCPCAFCFLLFAPFAIPPHPSPQIQQFIQSKDQLLHGLVQLVWCHQQFTDALQRPGWLLVRLQRSQQLCFCSFPFVGFRTVGTNRSGVHTSIGCFDMPPPHILLDVLFNDLKHAVQQHLFVAFPRCTGSRRRSSGRGGPTHDGDGSNFIVAFWQ